MGTFEPPNHHIRISASYYTHQNVTYAPEQVNDVVDAFNLQCMGSMDKKGLLAW